MAESEQKIWDNPSQTAAHIRNDSTCLEAGQTIYQIREQQGCSRVLGRDAIYRWSGCGNRCLEVFRGGRQRRDYFIKSCSNLPKERRSYLRNPSWPGTFQRSGSRPFCSLMMPTPAMWLSVPLRSIALVGLQALAVWSVDISFEYISVTSTVHTNNQWTAHHCEPVRPSWEFESHYQSILYRYTLGLIWSNPFCI